MRLSSATLSGRAPQGQQRRASAPARAGPLPAPAPIDSRARRRARPTAVARAAGGGSGGGVGGACGGGQSGGGATDASSAATDATNPTAPPPSNATTTTTTTLPVVLPPTSGPRPDVDARERALLYLTDAEADARVDAAAGLLACLDDLRPLDRKAHNASEHVWRSIAEIPATDRVRLLDALDAGGCRQMWRHTVGRYALPRERAEALLRGHTIWRDLPPALDGIGEEEEEEEDEEEEEEAEEGGVAEGRGVEASTGATNKGEGEGEGEGEPKEQAEPSAAAAAAFARRRKTRHSNAAVVEFEGVCERLVVESVPVVAQRPGDRSPIDLPEPGSAAADLRPRPGRPLRRTRRFRLQLFRHARTGQPYARVVLPGALSALVPEGLAGLLGGGRAGGAGGGRLLEGPSAYCRMDVGLSLAPVRRDAGADLTLAWPSRDDPDIGGLTRDDLPESVRGRWPAPERWSEDWKKAARTGARAGGGGGGGGGGGSGGGGGPGKVGVAEGWSPFSWTDRDYLRPAGPGVYVGCAYRPTDGLLVEDQFVWFVLAKVVRGDDFDDDGEDDDDDDDDA